MAKGCGKVVGRWCPLVKVLVWYAPLYVPFLSLFSIVESKDACVRERWSGPKREEARIPYPLRILTIKN